MGTPTLDEVYRQHADGVARIAARLMGSRHDVEDVVHDVFMVVQRRLPDYRATRASMSSWLYGITANVVRERRRSERWRRWLRGPFDEAVVRVPADAPDPARALETRSREALVYAALDGIKDKYRTVLILFEIEGMTGEQIAEVTGEKLATVWVRLHRGRALLFERARRLGREEKL
jgi:RNA polymerase sigma-70 factor (ECF subfamily)